MRCQESRLPLLVQGERQVRRVKYRLTHEYDAGITGGPDIAVLVDVQLCASYVPIVVARLAGRVLGALCAILASPFEQQALRAAAGITAAEARRGGRGRGDRTRVTRNLRKRITGRIHEAAVGPQVVTQPRAFYDVAPPLDAHVSNRRDLIL